MTEQYPRGHLETGPVLVRSLAPEGQINGTPGIAPGESGGMPTTGAGAGSWSDLIPDWLKRILGVPTTHSEIKPLPGGNAEVVPKGSTPEENAKNQAALDKQADLLKRVQDLEKKAGIPALPDLPELAHTFTENLVLGALLVVGIVLATRG